MPEKKGNPVGEEIRATELRVIDEHGEQAGIMLREVALSLAERKSLDLVLISPNANPPVAKIMDYGKFRYEQQKREKEAKKKQRVIQVKEIRLSTFIDSHDLSVKAGAATRFLKEGDKLKVSLRFKGRERGRTERGYEVVNRFLDLIRDYGAAEKAPAIGGRSLIVVVSPLPSKQHARMAGEPHEAPMEARHEAKDPDGAASGPKGEAANAAQAQAAAPGPAQRGTPEKAAPGEADAKNASDAAGTGYAEDAAGQNGAATDPAKPAAGAKNTSLPSKKGAKGPSDEMDI